MNISVLCSFTVYFEEPFWIGVYECTFNKKLEVAKIVFGAEPKDNEVYEFLIQNWSKLEFSQPIKENVKKHYTKNPKRLQKEINHHLLQHGVRTKAQEAISLQQEKNKLERKKYNRTQIEEIKNKKFELKQAKKKKKHKGH